jgi:hypothetical protein
MDDTHAHMLIAHAGQSHTRHATMRATNCALQSLILASSEARPTISRRSLSGWVLA